MEWWRKMLTIADFSLPEWSEKVIRGVVGHKKRLAFSAEHLGVSAVKGGERGVFYFKSKAASEVPFDFLGPYVEKAHKARIRVLIYFNVHWLESSYGLGHPDWLQLGRDGKPITNVYGKGASPCVNSPAYRKWSFQVIRDLGRYPIDGIFLDGPIFVPGGCWCEACRNKFRSRYAKDLPAKENWEDAAWKEFIEFRYDSITDYMRDARAALRKVRREAIIYMNGQGLWPSWPNGRDNRRLAAHQDIVGAEGGFIGGDLSRVSLWKPSMSAKLLETQAGGKPTVIFIAGKHCGWDLYCLSPEETTLLYAQTIAHGASPWYGMFYDTAFDAGALQAGVLNAFIKRNARVLDGTTSVADVALMWSVRTADYYRATVPVTDFTQEGGKLTRQQRCGDHYHAFCGFFECLTRRRIQFDVLDEQGVEEKLSGYRVLVLPSVACMSAHLAEWIQKWVHAGGVLLSTFETSCYTDWGVRRSSPALQEALGVECAGVEGPSALDYFDRGQGELFEGVGSALIPAPQHWVKAELTAQSARALAFFRERLPARYQPLPPISENPAIVENSYGSGRSLYFAGTMDEAYTDYHFPEHEALLSRPILAAVPQPVILEAPSTVQVVLRQQRTRKRLVIHLINATGEMKRPLTRIVGLEKLPLTLPGVASVTSAAYLEPGQARARKLATRKLKGGGVTLNVPRLGAYGVVVVEGAHL